MWFMRMSLLASLFSLLLSTVLVSTQSSPSDNSSSCVYPATCKNVTVCPYGVDLNTSPFYVHVYYDNTDSKLVDDACASVLPVGDGNYLIFLLTNYINGTQVISTLLQSQIADGVYRWQGKRNSEDGCSSCVFNDYTVLYLTGKCSDVVITYRCFTYGPCVDKFSGQDFLVAYSSSPTIPEECYANIQSAAESLGLNLGRYNPLPKKLGSQCVTQVGNATTINSCSVNACNAVVL